MRHRLEVRLGHDVDAPLDRTLHGRQPTGLIVLSVAAALAAAVVNASRFGVDSRNGGLRIKVAFGRVPVVHTNDDVRLAEDALGDALKSRITEWVSDRCLT